MSRGASPLLALLLAGCSHLLVTSPSSVYDEAQLDAGRAHLVTREGLALVSVGGTPEEVGAQLGTLLGAPMRALRDEFFELRPPTARQRVQAETFRVPDDHRRELQAFARVANVPLGDALVANTIIDSACTAFVASGAATRTGELLFARNMDFPPAHLLGPGTLVLLVRPAGKKAFVSLGWPGIAGVVSGMNEDGLCAAILINFGAGDGAPNGTPLPFVVREVLERCATVDEAKTLLRASACASGHFVMLADADTAAVVEPGAADRLPEDCLLTCSNSHVAREVGLQTDERACALADLLEAHRGRLDLDLARSILGATYLEYINAQAMVFEPATRHVSLAVGTTLRPAAEQDWVRVDLGQAFATGGFERAEPEALDDVDAAPHFSDHPYGGESVRRRYVAGIQRAVAEQEGDATRTEAERIRAFVSAWFGVQMRFAPGREGDAAKDRLTRAIADALDRLMAAFEATPTPALARQVAATRWHLYVEPFPLDPARRARLDALEARAREVVTQQP